MEYFFIVNPQAGAHNVQKLWPDIETELDKQHIAYRTLITEHDGHAVTLARRALNLINAVSNPNAVIVATGGDGTLHETMVGCMRYYADHPQQPKIPIAFLPVGSGNDFARALKIPLHWESALTQILSCHSSTTITIGRFINHDNQTDGYFTNNFGIGLDAAVVHHANHSLLKDSATLGKFSYMAAVFNTLIHFKGFRLTVSVPDQQPTTYQKAYLVTTTNLPYFGGGIKIAPDASVLDDTLDLIVVEKPNIFQLILFIVMLFLKRHLHLRFVHHYTEKKLFLKTEDSRYGQTDGEELGNKTFDLEFGTAKYPFWIK